MVAMAGGHDIKCAKYATYGTRELSKNILKALKGRKACLISNHGQIAFEENLPKAFELAEEVENISLQYITSLKLGKPKILSLKEMKKVLLKQKIIRGDSFYD
jgi:L-fuculose-phosphate aldolase